MNAAVQQDVPLTAAQRAAMIAEVQTLEEVGSRHLGADLETFLYKYLPSSFYMAPGDFHRGIYRDLEDMVYQRPIEGEVHDAAAYAYPRGHGKTTTITLGFALWVIAHWREMPHFQGEAPFILIVSDTITQAKDRSLDLRDEVEGNVQFIDDYGELKRPRRWTEKDWETTTGVRVMAVGSGSKVRGLLRSGRRPTLIVLDDLENDEAVATKKRRLKLERWLKKALIPTGLEGRLLTIAMGTILHADSLLSRLLDTDEHYPGWLKRRFAALYDDTGQPDVDGTIPLWPEGWSVDMLQRRRRKIGSVAFTQEYLNIAIDEDTTLFRMAWLKAARNRGKGIPFLYSHAQRIPFDLVVSTWDYVEMASKSESGAYQVVVTGWDLGIVDNEKDAQERDSDYTVGVTVGLDAMDCLHVRRIYRRRGMTPKQVRDRVIQEQSIVNADYVIVENNAAQKLHEIELRGVPNLPIVGHTTDKRKHSVYEGVPGMALLLETGRLDFAHNTEQERKRIDTLIAELHGLGLEAHDDMVMALWIAITAIRKWQRKRDKRRLRLIGKPPQGYVNVFPTREAA